MSANAPGTTGSAPSIETRGRLAWSIVAHSTGMCQFELGNPDAASVIVAIPLVVWFRPVIRQDRVGSTAPWCGSWCRSGRADTATLAVGREIYLALSE
jgi:hypothetical protein